MIVDLLQQYTDVFKTQPYFIQKENERPKTSIDFSLKQIALNKKNAYGMDIWFPVEFWKGNKKVIEIEACTVGVTMAKTIIRTVVSERKGTVKEQFNTDDYKFNIKGFLVGKGRFFPEAQIVALKSIFETNDPVELHGGYPEIFLDESCRVAVTSLEWPEVQGKSPWVRPFNLICESDYIQDLIIR